MKNTGFITGMVSVERVGRYYRACSMIYEDVIAVAYDIVTAVEDCERKVKLLRAKMELAEIREQNRRGEVSHA